MQSDSLVGSAPLKDARRGLSYLCDRGNHTDLWRRYIFVFYLTPRYTPIVRYRQTSGAVSNLNYHLVWTPKYRLSVLIGDVADDLESLIREKADELDVEVKHLEIKPDHLHLFVSAPPELAPSKLANQFKGYSSRVLRRKYRHLTSRMPTLWSRSYYVGSSGRVSDRTIARFIAAQEKRSG
jgi:putative transposase